VNVGDVMRAPFRASRPMRCAWGPAVDGADQSYCWHAALTQGCSSPDAHRFSVNLWPRSHRLSLC